MAGGQLSARQKMINLMYLIFIAMLALNMSKEVLSAFGLMNERLTESNETATTRNASFMDGLAEKANDQPAKYQPLAAKANSISSLANDFNTYLNELKGKMMATVDNPTDYEIMDKGDYLDQNFFKGDKIKPEGEVFLNQIATFRDGVVEILADDYKNISEDVLKKFNTDELKRGIGTVNWLEHHYKGFPLVASLTKMTQLQADIKTTQSEVLSAMLQGTLTSEVSMTNYTTLLEADPSYFNGESFDGSIVLGRKDASTRPNRVELYLDGRRLGANETSIESGKVKLNFNTGRAGEHKITGKLVFLEDGKETEVLVDQKFLTVPKPNAATISADKMNVVYRGVDNPMTISFAGISDNNVEASAQGYLKKVSGDGKYVMNVTRAKGREITINVNGTLADGSKVPDNATFRIKDIPRPTGTIRGEVGSVTMQRNSLDISTIGAKLDDFDFELPLNITGFSFKVPGQPTIAVTGNKLNARAKQALRKAKRGAGIQIFNIQAKIQGNSTYKLKKVSPVFIELTN